MSMMAAMLMMASAGTAAAPVTGDFDRDGTPDVAEIEDAPGGGKQLVVKPGREGALPLVVALIDQPETFHFGKATPGTYATACGKGLGPVGEPCPRSAVAVEGDTLRFGTDEASEAVAIWTGTAFERVWLSD
ncbi:hypothetical protein FHS96_004616 [Sphingomonas zeicaulis]|uniref:hypothetical protein n=1 Tax=Sphingomonas zeicaulis TaxID=1632740 RepID=UPI003D2179AA